MSQRMISWRTLATIGVVSALGACTQTPPQAVASNPPPVAPGPSAIWYHVNFDTNSFVIDANGQKIVADLSAYMRANPKSVATIVGRTDTVGGNDYNMHLSHQRADTVRDALVYGSKVSADRVETRWTGETRENLATANDVAASANRVVDIAVH